MIVLAVATGLLRMRATRVLRTALLGTSPGTGTIQAQWLRRLETLDVLDRDVLLQQLADITQQSFFRATHQ